VRAARTATALALAIVAVVLPGAAAAKGPNRGQIARAVSRAEGSSSLWATINICRRAGRRGGRLGVRGQMPALGFSATLRMTIRLGSWSARHHRFESISGSQATIPLSLGAVSSGRQQDGVVFTFTHPAGLLNGTVEFTWTRGGRVIGDVTRTTTAGHHDADYGSPARYSASSCRL
jgi:hypothetical protein